MIKLSALGPEPTPDCFQFRLKIEVNIFYDDRAIDDNDFHENHQSFRFCDDDDINDNDYDDNDQVDNKDKDGQLPIELNMEPVRFFFIIIHQHPC